MHDSNLKSKIFFSRLKKVLPDFALGVKEEKKFLTENVKKDSILLDVGCGYGRELKYLYPYYKKIIGIDNDQREINSAKVYLKDLNNVDLHVNDIYNYSLPTKEYDQIICIANTFGNFPDQKKALEKMLSLLKPKGTLLMSVFKKGYAQRRIKAYEKIGCKVIENIDSLVIFEGGFVSDEFNEKDIQDLASHFDVNVDFISSNGIFLLVKITKN